MLETIRLTAPRRATYSRRHPERTALHRIVREHLETFLAALESQGSTGLPDFVIRELRGFLSCGVLSEGFCRVRCEACGEEVLVGFS